MDSKIEYSLCLHIYLFDLMSSIMIIRLVYIPV
nr:MAG TPA_asm: hypothetical protein [Bacteriophage sp.]